MVVRVIRPLGVTDDLHGHNMYVLYVVNVYIFNVLYCDQNKVILYYILCVVILRRATVVHLKEFYQPSKRFDLVDYMCRVTCCCCCSFGTLSQFRKPLSQWLFRVSVI